MAGADMTDKAAAETTKKVVTSVKAFNWVGAVLISLILIGKMAGMIVFLALKKYRNDEELAETIFEIIESFFLMLTVWVASGGAETSTVIIMAFLTASVMAFRGAYALLWGTKS